MKFRNLAAAAAALTLTVTPVVAQAAVADMSREAVPASDESEIGGASTLLYVLAAVLAGVGIFLIADSGSKSP